MGSFDYTCAISGLAIGAGDKVRYMLVTQNPYHRGRTAGGLVCEMDGYWFPRTFPLRGEYDDYGGVENLQEGPQAATWLDGFRVDLVEKGWGDNSCHDVPVAKSMTLANVLGAVQEGRVHVRPNVDRPLVGALERAAALLGEVAGKPRAPSVPKGIPTRRRVERALVALGHKISTSSGSGVLVNRVDRNTVRVRIGEYGKRTEGLAEIRDALANRWAGMVCCGTGSYADEAELLLRPLPGVRPRGRSERREAALCVTHVMIREDVWQAICALTLRTDYSGAETLARDVAAAWTTWEKATGKGEHSRFGMRHDAPWITDTLPFTVGLGTHWWAMVDAWKAGNVTDAERADFLQTAGEMIFVMRWLSTTRYQWRPSTATGPQCGEWQCHAALMVALYDVAAKEAAERARERDTDAA